MPHSAQALPSFMSKQVAAARRFYFEPPSKQPERLAVVSGGWERSDRNYVITRPGFRYFGIEFVAGGRGTLKMRGREFALSRGVVFAYGPGVQHEITTDAKDRLSKYFVDFTGAGAATAMKAAGIGPGSCQTVAIADDVQSAFEHLLAAGRRGTPTAAKIAALQGEILLCVITDVRLARGAGSAQSRQTFLRCRNLIEEQFATLRTAEEAAAACGVAPAYLSRLFRRFGKQPAYQFLIRMKMNQAAAILRRQALNVSETAAVLGMDPFHFSRVFKRVHGRSPVSFLNESLEDGAAVSEGELE
ncbi:MAG TPA: helix-turn-helix domain-containing protein [Opitutus sp.]|nr:helix-turn-helix domain-containing protein [Opitutus sp.]